MNLRLAFASLLLRGVRSQSPFVLSGYVAEGFFDSNRGVEASGLDISPDGSHLVAVGDNGNVMFLNLNDDRGHCILDLDDDVDGTDFEGVAIDPNSWTPNDMHAYIVHEGADDDEPYLYKIKYEFDPGTGSCSALLVDSKSLRDAIPCLPTSNGIESLGLKSPSSDAAPAVFFVGIQDTGKVYEVTSEGLSNGPYCYDGGVGDDDISASTYNSEYGHLWTRIESQDTIAVVDPTNDCPLATYELGSYSADEEGMAFDWTNGLFYLAVDGQGDGSYVAVYDFTYPDDLDECVGESPGSCTGFALCGGASFPPSLDSISTTPPTQDEEENSGPTTSATALAEDSNSDTGPITSSEADYPTAFPTYINASGETDQPTLFPTHYPTAQDGEENSDPTTSSEDSNSDTDTSGETSSDTNTSGEGGQPTLFPTHYPTLFPTQYPTNDAPGSRGIFGKRLRGHAARGN